MGSTVQRVEQELAGYRSKFAEANQRAVELEQEVARLTPDSVRAADAYLAGGAERKKLEDLEERAARAHREFNSLKRVATGLTSKIADAEGRLRAARIEEAEAAYEKILAAHDELLKAQDTALKALCDVVERGDQSYERVGKERYELEQLAGKEYPAIRGGFYVRPTGFLLDETLNDGALQSISGLVMRLLGDRKEARNRARDEATQRKVEKERRPEEPVTEEPEANPQVTEESEEPEPARYMGSIRRGL